MPFKRARSVGYSITLVTVLVLAAVSFALRIPSYLIDQIANCIMSDEELEDFNKTARSGSAKSSK